MKPTDVDIYAEWTDAVVIYAAAIEKFLEREREPQEEFLRLIYNAASLAGEAGETLNLLMQILRNSSGEMSEKQSHELMIECGDCLFYLIRLIVELGYDPAEVMDANMRKLSTRKKQGKLAHSRVSSDQLPLPGLDNI